MTELYLYGKNTGLFHSILRQSAIMQGNYHVSPNYGHDLNTGNLDEYLKGGGSKTYPMVVCMPPRGSMVRINGYTWQSLRFQLFFLTLDQRNDDGTLKQPDSEVFASTSTPPDDWALMRKAATDFMGSFQLLQQSILPEHLALRQLLQIDSDRAETLPITRRGNDVYNGISLTFSALLQTDICVVTDYGEEFLTKLEVPGI